ncbi:MAG: NADH-quinone oxidoreductase subunit N, partial [Methyloceanibacter sp.]
MLETLNLEFILPELILSCGAMALLMIGVATKRERGELVLWLAILIIGAAGVFVARGEGTATLFSGSFIVDPYARVLKLLTLTGAAAALLMSIDYWRRAGGLRFEFPVLVLLATTGMMMMISANDLI